MVKLMVHECLGNTCMALTTSLVIQILLPSLWSALWCIAEVHGTLIHPCSRLYYIMFPLFNTSPQEENVRGARNSEMRITKNTFIQVCMHIYMCEHI